MDSLSVTPSGHEEVIMVSDSCSEDDITEIKLDDSHVADRIIVYKASDDDSEENLEDLLVESGQTCNICSKTFSSIEYFLIHQRLHRQGKLDKPSCDSQPTKYRRGVCEKNVSSTGVSNMRIKMESESSLYSTPETAASCTEKNVGSVCIASKPSTSVKPVQKARTRMRENADDLLVEGPRVCKFCGKTFYSMDYYRIHQRVHVSEKLKHVPLKPSARLSSHYPGSKFPSVSTEGHQVVSVYPQMGVHNVSVSNLNTKKMPPTKKCCVCDVCSLTFPNYRSLTLHKKVHRKGLCTVYPLYICSVCNRGFVSKSSFLNHCAYHGAKPWTCNTCGMTFSKKMYLGMHRSSKHAKKTQVVQKCDDCDKVFEKEKDLKKHIKMHESQKEKFLQIRTMCSLCNKMLPMMSTKDLRIHMGVHFGELLKCHICPDIFYKSREFKKHMDRHLGL